MACPICEREGRGATAHETQRRILTAPNVLVVQVRRRAGRRLPVAVEEQLELPGLPVMELVGVVYHSGATIDSGHYTCLARGPRGRFWFYDDDKAVPRMDAEVAHVKPTQVYMLVYCRPDGKGQWQKEVDRGMVVDLGEGQELAARGAGAEGAEGSEGRENGGVKVGGAVESRASETMTGSEPSGLPPGGGLPTQFSYSYRV